MFSLETALKKLRGTTDVMMDIEEMRVCFSQKRISGSFHLSSLGSCA